MPARNVIALVAIVAVAVLISVGALLIAGQTSTPQTDRLTIATTIFPLADIAKNVAGESVNVIQLLPTGASPHSYSLTPKQLVELGQAQALFIVGHGLDDWAADALRSVTDAPIITVDQNIELRQLDGSTDPHYWLNVPNAKQIAQTISRTLQDVDPNPAAAGPRQQAVVSYLKQLDDLETELQTQARQASKKDFISLHQAWSYFTAQYGFTMLAAYEPIEGKPPSIRDIQRLQNIIQDNNITDFYTEPQKQTTSATRFLHEDFGLTIKILDPLGGQAERDSYLNLMRANLRTLVQ